MVHAVTSDDRIVRSLGEPSYTPARRDLPAVAALVAGDDEAISTNAVRAVLRAAPADSLAALTAAFAGASEAGGARLAAAIGQLARAHPTAGGDAIAALIGLLDPDRHDAPRVRRAAVVALGKVGGAAASAALVAYAGRAELPPDHRRALAEALGKVGGADAEQHIAALAAAAGDDRELRRRGDRALLMAERDRGRDTPSHVRGDVAVPAGVPIAVRCRAGLEGLLADELRAAGLAPASTERGVVRVATGAALGRFHAARTWLSLGLERRLPPGADLPARITAALVEARGLLAALTDGPIRWRLDFAGGGHRRAVVWQTAQAVRAAAPELVNDPTATTWDVVVADDDASLELRPRRLDDPRFAWRVADVSAASHPTIAAALARVAGRRDRDIVWDPFCGSGSELIERALLGGVARLFGSDLDSRALEAARANLAAAGLDAELALADALVHHPPAVTLIITNPPLGRRIRGDVGGLLERFAVHAARVLEPGGRLVWITPAATRTERAARRAGLRLDDRRSVDLGGYDADLERWLH